MAQATKPDIKQKKFFEIRDFCVSYKNVNILNKLNFHINEKECFTIVGKSGAGKTTLLRSLIGLKKPSSGQVILDNEDIVTKTETELIPIRKKVAYAFQNGALFDSMTVFENLAFPLREHTNIRDRALKNRVYKELEEFELLGTQNLYPSELSGGMKKRIGIARSMMLKPKAILYDEPTVSLDPYSTANLVKIMLKLKKRGTTSVLVTHNMSVATQVSDRIALLSNGTFSAIGTLETMTKNYNIQLKNFINGVKVRG